ncbi:hypothetical protein ORV05_10370 [Amycolatopsis cynarae]|uniref:MFS transporter n=1 Tax=Amycolatopsis cynarae TaxID=2995223 RepID=A0ABY7B885_9PSEU|nr:hypothetical protein [Amycolatopsis sp. HUAS 11-8]WAL68144.1 hypothetical protein ORV05_10370 [Amycolatopsis sp. HUAS 11-8]
MSVGTSREDGALSPPRNGTEAGVAARLERLPLSRYQRSLFLVIATAWLFDSVDRHPRLPLGRLPHRKGGPQGMPGGLHPGRGPRRFAYGHAGDTASLLIAGSFLQFFFFGMWSSIYAYTPELFPTRLRRLGALIGPSLVPLVLTAGGTTLVVAFLPETKHRTLEEISR